MDAHAPETAAENTLPPTHPENPNNTDQHFDQVVRDALEGVGGVMLFKMRLDVETGSEQVAAAAIGEGDERRFLLLTLPAGGDRLKVEPAAKSSNPLALIAASYAGLADALAAA